MIRLEPIAVVRSPWSEKFGIPRQSGLAPEVELSIELADSVPAEALRGLEAVSHVWLVCWFHASADEGWRPTVRPPRLGGAKRLGVFATRSPHRPNPLALTLARLVALEPRRLRVCGADLLDGTPVLDIKPYLPWAEARPEARCEWAPAPPPSLPVEFGALAREQLEASPNPEQLADLIRASLRGDPRPASHRRAPEREYGVTLAGHNVRFCVRGGRVEVLSIEALKQV